MSQTTPALSPDAFELLLRALSDDRGRAGEIYENLRERLVRFFTWEECQDAEDLADRTIDRVARKVAEGEKIQEPGKYFHTVARFLLLERTRERAKESRAARELAVLSPNSATRRGDLDELDRCLGGLDETARSLILRYYAGSPRERIRNRQQLSRELKLPLNAVRNRALRIRRKLERCLEMHFDCDK